QFSHRHVHVHYLDIWAFPPAMTAIFESLRTEAVSSSPPFVEPVRTRQQELRAAASELRSAVFRPSSCLTGLHQPKSGIGDDIWPDDWSHSRAQVSDLQVDLLRASRAIQDQRHLIELLSENLAQLRQGHGVGRRFAGLWKSRKK